MVKSENSEKNRGDTAQDARLIFGWLANLLAEFKIASVKTTILTAFAYD